MPLVILGTKDNPQYLETVINLFEQLSACIKHRELFHNFSDSYEEESLYDNIKRIPGFENFNNFLQLNHHLSSEVKTRFLEYKEAKLQDRYGNFIANSLINFMIPVYNTVKNAYEDTPVVSFQEKQLNSEQNKNLEDRFNLFGVCLRLFEWIDTICMNLQAFTPELYERYSEYIRSVKPIVADLPSIRPSLPDIEPQKSNDNSTMTIRVVEPTSQKRPDSDFTRCLDQVRSLSHNATLFLEFSGFTVPTKYAEYIQNNSPQLLDEGFCNGLNNGLNTEIRNNFMRFTESKVQDRYASDLIRVLKETLNPSLDTFDRVINNISTKKEIETKQYPPNSKELFTSIEFVNYQKELNGLIGPNIRVRIWRDTIEQFLSDYTPEHYRRYKGKNESSIIIESKTKLQWKGEKTDLAELIWVLAKSERITDTSTGQPVTLKELAYQLVNILGIEALDIANLMKGRYGTKSKPTTYKAQDGKNFINALQRLLDERVLD